MLALTQTYARQHPLTRTALVALCIFAGFALSAARAQSPHIVMDADTGEIISGHGIDHRWYPASLTKLMSAYVALRAVQEGEMEMGSPVIMSRAAVRQPPSRMGYKRGVELRLDTALNIILIKSANDVSRALAEAVAGSLPAFVARMNREAVRLGLMNTRFANANGLHDRSQHSSARDMAMLARALWSEFPAIRPAFAAVAIRTPVKTHYSYNLLLERFDGANGMKTGFVCASGYNMVASAKRKGRTLIAVVLGRASQTDRAVGAAKLLTAAFRSAGAKTSFGKPVRGQEPRNMRSVLCTEQARNQRYDPGAGQAKIASPHLQPRQTSNRIIEVRPGGIDGPVSVAVISARLKAVEARLPLPTLRPDYNLNTGSIRLRAIGARTTGRLPLPQSRPAG